MKCKRPKHGLTPFRVAWPTACRFTQRPCGQYNSAGRICQISRPSCYCEGAPRPWQSVLFCASGGVLSLGFCRGGALSRPFGNTHRGGGGCSAPAGAGYGFPRQCEHWLGMTPLRGVFGRTGSSAPTEQRKGCGGETAGRCTPRVLVPLRSTAWASPPTERPLETCV